jgi:hypothetical protein
VLARGLRVATRCSAACSVTVVATVDTATARRLGLGRNRALGTARARVPAGERKTVAVKLSPRTKRRYPRTGRVRVTLAIQARGSAGERAVTTRTVSVRAT